jgi:hypothetical protein
MAGTSSDDPTDPTTGNLADGRPHGKGRRVDPTDPKRPRAPAPSALSAPTKRRWSPAWTVTADRWGIASLARAVLMGNGGMVPAVVKGGETTSLARGAARLTAALVLVAAASANGNLKGPLPHRPRGAPPLAG